MTQEERIRDIIAENIGDYGNSDKIYGLIVQAREEGYKLGWKEGKEERYKLGYETHMTKTEKAVVKQMGEYKIYLAKQKRDNKILKQIEWIIDKPRYNFDGIFTAGKVMEIIEKFRQDLRNDITSEIRNNSPRIKASKKVSLTAKDGIKKNNPEDTHNIKEIK